MIAEKLATKSNPAPRARARWPVPIPKPTTQRGGTRAMATAVPAAVVVAFDRAVTTANDATSAQQVDTRRSRAVGDARAAMGAVTSWKGNATVMSAAPATTSTMLRETRKNARRTSSGEPTARPIPSSTVGVISGEMSIAPSTTAELPSARPRVAMAMASTSCSQYIAAPSTWLDSMWTTSRTRPSGVTRKARTRGRRAQRAAREMGERRSL